MLKPLKKYVKTITYDNGREFNGHMDISGDLNYTAFFARPYHSWERGLNENSNGPRGLGQAVRRDKSVED